MTETSTLLVEHIGPVDRVTLNRPDQLNAVNPDMTDALLAYFGGLAERPATRVVVLSGAGKAFCVGVDLKARAEYLADELPLIGKVLADQRRFSEIILRMRRAPQPIVAAVQGATCGIGFAMMLAADIRVAGASARMNAAPIKVGLSGCDVGLSYFLPRMAGSAVAAELMLTGRFIDAARALSLGLVSEVVPDDRLRETAESYVADMLMAAPLGLRLTKQGLNSSIDANDLASVIELEDRNQVLCCGSGDFREGMRAFIGKRPARYAQDRSPDGLA
jgi:enoyl-CoA hydratase/carnithine racemase